MPNLEICSPMLYRLTYMLFDERCAILFNLYIHVYTSYTNEFENDEVERNHFVLYIYCLVLHIGIYLYCIKKQKDEKVLFLLFTCKTRTNIIPGQIECLVVFYILNANT